MGRPHAGIAGGADAILVPEHPYDLEQVADTLRKRHRHGRTYSVVVVAEGVPAPDGTEIVAVPLEEGCAEVRGMPDELIDVAETFYG